MRPLIAIGGLIAGLLFVVAPATASASTSHPAHFPCTRCRTYYKYRAVDKVFKGRHSGDWRFCGHGVNGTPEPIKFSCTQTVSSSTTVEVSETFTAAEISTAIGFKISHTYTYSTSLGLLVTIPAHHQIDVKFGTYYGLWHFGMERRKCVETNGSTTCYPWSSPVPFSAQHALAPAIGAFNLRPYH